MSKYNNQIYKIYEEEYNKNVILSKEVKNLKLEISDLNYKLNIIKKSVENEYKKENEKLINDNNDLKLQLKNALNEIERLKNELNNSEDNNYKIDKLTNQINKNSTNSSIPSSKEIRNSNKTGANLYNHRERSKNKNGGQFGHPGKTLTKQILKEKIEKNNLEIKPVIRYIKGNEKQEDIVKYKIGMSVNLYVEEHIFKYIINLEEKLPKEYYSDVTYNDELKAIIVTLGNYYSLSYNKVKEILNDFNDGIINISEGTVDNIYEEFSLKSEETLNNITNNLLNGKYQHTDETVTKENGKDTYYRGYANEKMLFINTIKKREIFQLKKIIF